MFQPSSKEGANCSSLKECTLMLSIIVKLTVLAICNNNCSIINKDTARGQHEERQMNSYRFSESMRLAMIFGFLED